MSVLGLLVTGPSEKRLRFHMAVCVALNSIDQRGETVRYSCMEDDLPIALEAAKGTDVTVQKIVTVGTKNKRRVKLARGASATVSDCIEEYPVLHLSSTGEKWRMAKGVGR